MAKPARLPEAADLQHLKEHFPDSEASAERIYQLLWSEGFVCPASGNTSGLAHTSLLRPRVVPRSPKRKGHVDSIIGTSLASSSDTRTPRTIWPKPFSSSTSSAESGFIAFSDVERWSGSRTRPRAPDLPKRKRSFPKMKMEALFQNATLENAAVRRYPQQESSQIGLPLSVTNAKPLTCP